MQRTRLFRQEPISFVLRGFSAAFWKRCEQKNANWNHGLSLIQIILVLIIMNLNCSKLHDLSLLTSWKIIKLPFGPVNVGDPGICIHAYLKSYSRNWWSFEPIESLPFFTLAGDVHGNIPATCEQNQIIIIHVFIRYDEKHFKQF